MDDGTQFALPRQECWALQFPSYTLQGIRNYRHFVTISDETIYSIGFEGVTERVKWFTLSLACDETGAMNSPRHPTAVNREYIPTWKIN